jgi:hypothetical protein
MTGAELIVQERQHQIDKGNTLELDKLNNDENQLVDAISVLVTDPPEELREYWLESNETPPVGWDYSIWNSLLRREYSERIIIVGALAAAEYDRKFN